ncbi:MAG: ORF6N domain-containing protein [Pseudomonadota bacterium]
MIFAHIKNMNKDLLLYTEQDFKNKIYTIRGVQVMLDSDLSDFYKVETKYLNKAVKRNIDRFPPDFMFQLSDLELKEINLRFQFGTSGLKRGGRRYLPYVFTEQGVAVLELCKRLFPRAGLLLPVSKSLTGLIG